jgi:hypothetical protein
MALAERLGRTGIVLLVLNEIRGAIMVAMLLSSGTHLLGSGASLQDLSSLIDAGLACRVGAARCQATRESAP